MEARPPPEAFILPEGAKARICARLGIIRKVLEISMKVFVTGAEGFIGSHVIEALVRAGHDVTALVQYNSRNFLGWLEDLEPDVISSIRPAMGDIRDSGMMLEALKGQERVIHLAALVAIPYSYLAPSSYVDTNMLGTLNVLEASKRNGIERVIHTSTSEVYGSAQYVPIDERHPLVGQSPYSASKIGADQLAYSYWASFETPVVTVRPFNTYGPRQSQRAFIPSLMVQHLDGRKTLSLGSLSPTRDLTFVSDSAHGFVSVMESDQGLGETFNMGSGFEISMADVVSMVSDISGKPIDITVDEARVRPKKSEVERLWSDSTKISQVFGWQPKHQGLPGLRVGLEKTYEWFSRNFKNGGYDSSKYVR